MTHADLKTKGRGVGGGGGGAVSDRAEVLSAGHLSSEVEEKQLICFRIIVLVLWQNGETERDWEEASDPRRLWRTREWVQPALSS